MSHQLTGEDFNNLFRYFTATAFRLEAQPVYKVTDERESFEEFLDGEPRPVTDFPFYALWLERIRAATAEGKRVERVRILERTAHGLPAVGGVERSVQHGRGGGHPLHPPQSGH